MGITTLSAVELEDLYCLFRQRFFENKLPQNVYIGLRRGLRSDGLTVPEKWDNPSGISDEILIDESLLNGDRELFYVTLVHQMIHLYQAYFGKQKPKRHNHTKEFAQIACDLGIPTASDDKDGEGKDTGRAIHHTVDPNGRFKQVIQELEKKGLKMSIKPRDAAAFLIEDKPKASRRDKVTCRECSFNAWLKPGGNVICHNCYKAKKQINVMTRNDE